MTQVSSVPQEAQLGRVERPSLDHMSTAGGLLLDSARSRAARAAVRRSTAHCTVATTALGCRTVHCTVAAATLRPVALPCRTGTRGGSACALPKRLNGWLGRCLAGGVRDADAAEHHACDHGCKNEGCDSPDRHAHSSMTALARRFIKCSGVSGRRLTNRGYNNPREGPGSRPYLAQLDSLLDRLCRVRRPFSHEPSWEQRCSNHALVSG
jgi:hypothetical protein